MAYNDPDILLYMRIFSLASNNSRNPEFFLAWFIEEQGWDASWSATNNPYNISSKSLTGEPWFNGATGIDENSVINYVNPWYGIAATLSLIQALYPEILSNEENLRFLDQWAANPNYVAEIENIYSNSLVWEAFGDTAPQAAETTSQASETTNPTPQSEYYTVQPGDTLWKIAINVCHKPGSYYTYLAKINNIANPNLITVGERLKL